MEQFKQDVFRAIENKISLNPVLHSFQDTFHAYKIDEELVHAFFHSMEMDLEKKVYDEDSYQEYIYGSAEVVGLMCLRIFSENDDALYDELKLYARSLGAAFQKVNFLRDVQNDFLDKGRVYFPGVDFSNFNADTKAHIEADIEKDFAHALVGIMKLPESSRHGVLLAYHFYIRLLRKIKITPASQIQTTRIRVSDYEKAGLMINALLLK